MSATTPNGDTESDTAGEHDGAQTDVTDADGFREELIRLAEDRDAAESGDAEWDAVEDRASQLLSDIRRTRPADDTDGDNDE